MRQTTGFAERFMRTVRTECLDRLILNRQHLERGLEVFVDHYDGHRPHRAPSLAPPATRRAGAVPTPSFGDARILRRDRLGRVVHEYSWWHDEVFAPIWARDFSAELR